METSCPPARKAARAASIDGWRSTLSNRSRTAGRIMRGTLGFCARGWCAFADFFQDFGRGVAGDDRSRDDATTGGFHLFAPDDLVAGPIAALDEHVGKQAGDDFAGSQIVENDDGIDGFESGEDSRALAFGNHRAALALELANAGVAVEADDQDVAQSAGLLETADVAGMQQVEAAVGEDEAAAVAFPGAKPQNRLLEREDGIQRVSMRARYGKGTRRESLVYHARELRRVRGARAA